MLAELIAENQPCVALTVAGASTESGIPDFRSATGIWKQYDPYVVASIDGCAPFAVPVRTMSVARFRGSFAAPLTSAMPSFPDNASPGSAMRPR